MTNQVTDHGLLESTMCGIKDSEPEKIIEVVADKGYEATEDMVDCLEKGIIPHVITDEVGIECEPIRVDDYTGKKMTFFHDPDGLPLELHE